MDKRLLLLRLTYWIGAIFDGLMIIPMMSVKAAGVLMGMPGFSPGAEYRFAMALGAALMAGWTVLLIWADRKPVERRSVLLMTLFPVLSGLIAGCVYGAVSGAVKAQGMVSIWISQGILLALGCAAYIHSSPLAEEGNR